MQTKRKANQRTTVKRARNQSISETVEIWNNNSSIKVFDENSKDIWTMRNNGLWLRRSRVVLNGIRRIQLKLTAILKREGSIYGTIYERIGLSLFRKPYFVKDWERTENQRICAN